MKTAKIVNIIALLIIIFFLLIEIFPIYWIILNSFKGFKDLIFYPPKFVFKPTIENYVRAVQKNYFFRSILQSALIAIVCVLASVSIGAMAAYGIVRLKAGGTGLFMYMVSSRMVPSIVILLPMYIVFSKIKLLDTYLTLIIVYSTLLLSFTVWQMSSFLKEVPMDIEDAAIIDGCHQWQVFFKIILPISKPGLTAVAIFAFLFAWNDFIFASILTGSRILTAPVAATQFITDREIPWGVMSAACTMIMIPAFIFILIVQKQMVRGLTMGALKE